MVNFSVIYCHNNKRKNKDKTFSSSLKYVSVARVLIAKLNREKDNLPSKKINLLFPLSQYSFKNILSSLTFLGLAVPLTQKNLFQGMAASITFEYL